MSEYALGIFAWLLVVILRLLIQLRRLQALARASDLSRRPHPAVSSSEDETLTPEVNS
jgi:hypothetical protein